MRRRKTHLIILQRTVVGKCATVLEPTAGEDQTLLIRWDVRLVCDLGSDFLDAVSRLDIQSDCCAYECFDEDLHGVIVSMTRML